MNFSQISITIAIGVLLAIVVLLFIMGQRAKGVHLTPLAGVAFAFIIAGIIYSENRLMGYGLMGVGVMFAVIDMIRKLRKNKKGGF